MAMDMTTTLATATPTLTTGGIVGCTPFILPANGILSIWGAEATRLAFDGLYQPDCTPQYTGPEPAIIVNGGVSNIDEAIDLGDLASSTIVDGRDPFYASIFPQCYALAATTVLAYVLFIMLLIVPRSFLDGGIVVLGRRGFTNGPSHGISIGGRPWLQKFAALSVTISLTIATVDTFRVAERQYGQGTQNAAELQREVLGGLQLKIIQLISDTFLWLAQAQTLIRLFPRQREKIIIKWTAFSLITLDVIFGALNSFLYVGIGSAARPLNFTEPVGALSYLFQLSLGLLYAAWVIYYALMKKRYAFYHPLMKNISLMAALSIISILVPVVFFVLDIAKPDFTGWGEYVRWVGAAAASVVVWEWVERIEALEREEKKDGILGREVFDGDEMMDNTTSDFQSWHRHRKSSRKPRHGGDGGEDGVVTSTSDSPSSTTPSRTWPAMSAIANRYANNSSEAQPTAPISQPSSDPSAKPKAAKSRFLQAPFWPSRPAPAVTPVSRTETASADSTVYAVRYQPLTESSARGAPDRASDRLFASSENTSLPAGSNVVDRSESSSSPPDNDNIPAVIEPKAEEAEPPSSTHLFSPKRLGLFKGASRGPPAEVLPHTAPRQPKAKRNHEGSGRWDLRGRWEDFAANHAEKVMERMRGTPDTDSLPVTVIPAPPRPGAALAQLLEEERNGSGQAEASGTNVFTPSIVATGSTTSAIPLMALPPRNPSAGTSSRYLTTSPGDSIGGSTLPRTPAPAEDRVIRVPSSRRPVVRYESLPVLPSNGTQRAQRDDIHGSDNHRQRRTTPQPPPG